MLHLRRGHLSDVGDSAATASGAREHPEVDRSEWATLRAPEHPPLPQSTGDLVRPVVLAHIPGALPALEAVQYAGGVLLSPLAAEQLVFATLHAADPLIRADLLADIADDALFAALRQLELGFIEGAVALQEFGDALDHASHEIRKALAR